MSQRKHWLTACVLMFLAGTLPAQETPADLLARAERLAREKPEALRALGLAEIRRAAGQGNAALEELARAADAAGLPEGAVMGDVLCWRLLPLGPAQTPALRTRVAWLRARGAAGTWLPVYELALALREQDRAALLAAAKAAPLPDHFPSAEAEKAHRALLVELGVPRGRAGLEVVAGRSAEPLHALRDLDRGLTREAAFLRGAGRNEEARTLEECRGRLRDAYLAASRHVVERLFALNLLSKAGERDALHDKARALPYLGDRAALAGLLGRLDEEQAWMLLVRPLLESEVRLVEAPPDLAGAGAPDAVLKVEARRKTEQDGLAIYHGDVRVRVGGLRIRCERLSLIGEGEKAGSLLAGSGAVAVSGILGVEEVRGERFSFSPDTGVFTFAGDVVLRRPDGVLKLRACTVDRGGEVRDRRSLLDDFDAATPAERLRLLPDIRRVYPDEELPPAVRYFLALALLRPHLTWHAAWAPPEDKADLKKQVEKSERVGAPGWRWHEAHPGEEWMQADIPVEVRAALRDRRARLPEGDREDLATFFWRLGDATHADVHRALALLEGVGEPFAAKARRWAEEVRRNNTVATLEVPGGFEAGRDARVVLDVRNGDAAALRLYRVRRPEDLVWVTARIGTDFVYRDYEIQGDPGERRLLELRAKRERVLRVLRCREQELPPPAFLVDTPVWRGEKRVADLPLVPRARLQDEEEWEEEEDDYFDEACTEHQERLARSYRPGSRRLSSWQCDRVLEVPGAALREPGAYVLATEVNGQVAYCPLVVDPLSLTLRRCRDGVFVLVSDADGRRPVPQATVHAREMLGTAATDTEGAAFARVFAAGDRALVIHKEGRFAVGGFGRVFDGVYHSVLEARHLRRLHERLRRARHADEAELQIYADQHVLAALTDRPTYRPGQTVRFKLIVRRLAPAAQGASLSFRADDFELASRLRVPDTGTEVPYEVLDPRGRVVASGRLVLNDHGTAASEVGLRDEAPTGAYTLRVRLAGTDRLVPDAFEVRYYRRPHFEVEVRGVHAKVRPGEELAVEVSGRYYFGKEVTAGRVRLEFVRPEERRPLAQAEKVLDGSGKALVTLPLPADLEGGSGFVVCELTDDSGRTVSRAVRVEVDRPGTAPRRGLAALPRFVPLKEKLSVAAAAKEVVAEQGKAGEDGKGSVRRFLFPVQKDRAAVTWPAPGWYTLTAGDEAVDVFVFGGSEHPHDTWPGRLGTDPPRPSRSGWVNLADYAGQEDPGGRPDDRHSAPLLALFDRHHARVGDRLPLLVYAPCRRARLVFTIEGRTVVDYFTTWTADEPGHYHVVEVPIRRRHLPNFYLQGRIIAVEGGEPIKPIEMEKEIERQKKPQDRGEDPRWCRVDVLDPDAAAGCEKLRVEVRPDRDEYRPGENVGVRLTVTDLQGRPRGAEVCLSAVDESVYTFGEDRAPHLAHLFSDPHPPQRFYRKTWRDSLGNRWTQAAQRQRLEDLRKQHQQLAKESMAVQAARLVESVPAFTARRLPPVEIRGLMPVTGLPLERLRSDFRETAAWLPQLQVADDGVLRTSFRLPDSLTSYRLRAVALTRQTEIGVGTARVRAALPLAVQVFLPRFAVEKDRLQAVAVIHNGAARERACELTWEVEGARVEQPAGTTAVRVPARGSARVGLWLIFDRAGPVKLRCRVREGDDADAEMRTLTVQPLGREREVAFDGVVNGSARVRLPAGFVARELQVVLARGDAARALDGLDSLLDYPYGCVEQTMSRFLPAVVVRQASRQTPVQLPPDAAARLPDILARGLARLYHFQHADGGWGWWEHDATDPRMSVYVVEGLVRCRLAGVAVDAEILASGIAYVRKELESGSLPAPVAAKAWLALALGGAVDVSKLGEAARKEWPAPEDRCRLALACRAAGLREPAERLWASLRAWQPEGAEELALRLTAQLAFGEPLAACRETAGRLLAQRVGLRWASTQATAQAIEALAEMLVYLRGATVARKVEVRAGGKTLLAVAEPADLRKLVYRVRVPAAALPAGDALEVDMRADCDEAVHYTIVAAGVQALDEVGPSGTDVKVSRTLETPEGKPPAGPVRVGDVVRVRLSVELTRRQEYLLLEDRRPAGCEFADDFLGGSARPAVSHHEFRDDRVCVFLGALPAGRHEVVYYLRAETPGTSHLLPGVVYPMYADHLRGETASARLEVRPDRP